MAYLVWALLLVAGAVYTEQAEPIYVKSPVALQNRLPENVLDRLKEILERVREIIAAFPDNLPDILARIEDLIEKLPELINNIPEIIERIREIINDIQDRLPEIIDHIVENLPDIIDKIPAILERIREIIDRIPDLVQLIKDNIPAITVWLARVVERIRELVGKLPDLIDQIPDSIIDRIPEIIERAREMLERVREVIAILPDLVELLPENVQEALSTVREALKKLRERLAELIDRIRPRLDRFPGGQETSIEAYPSIVQVECGVSSLWSQCCVGSLLTSRYILTAAQCMYGLNFANKFRQIRAGSSDRGTGGQVRGVEYVVKHPTWRAVDNSNDGDIGLVRVTIPFDYSSVVQQAGIIAQGASIPAGVPVIHAGWGALDASGENIWSSRIHHLNTFVVDREECASRYANEGHVPRTVTANMICTGYLNIGGRDACFGNEGGPVYYPDATYGNMVIGVNSFGWGCGNATFSRVNTNVASYTNWILSNAV